MAQNMLFTSLLLAAVFLAWLHGAPLAALTETRAWCGRDGRPWPRAPRRNPESSVARTGTGTFREDTFVNDVTEAKSSRIKETACSAPESEQGESNDDFNNVPSVLREGARSWTTVSAQFWQKASDAVRANPLPAAAAASLLGVVVLISAMMGTASSPTAKVAPASAPKVVSMQQKPTAVPPVSQVTTVELVSEEKPAPERVPVPVPPGAPLATSIQPVPTRKVAQAPTAPSASSLQVQGARQPQAIQKAANTEIGWLRQLTKAASAGLRSAADGLPQAELTLEENLPKLEAGVSWALETRPETAGVKAAEALQVTQGAALKGAYMAVHTGLEVGSVTAEFTAENLPIAGKMLQGAVVKAMPSVQSSLHQVADVTRGLAGAAEDYSQPDALPRKVPREVGQVLGTLPGPLDIAASSLDTAADAAPGAEAAVNYAAGKAMPILQAVLTSISEITSDAAAQPVPEKLPLPEAAQVSSTFAKLGVDTDSISAQAKALVNKTLAQATARLPDPKQVADRGFMQVFGEPGTVRPRAATSKSPVESTAANVPKAAAAPSTMTVG
mmetsp:Transcript_115046/g.229074  ORF Transcript_115046/g.229074 Transcript_115046/m.229074 type:complete len:558 (-) Transcript_115046:283-1956(-)